MREARRVAVFPVKVLSIELFVPRLRLPGETNIGDCRRLWARRLNGANIHWIFYVGLPMGSDSGNNGRSRIALPGLTFSMSR